MILKSNVDIIDKNVSKILMYFTGRVNYRKTILNQSTNEKQKNNGWKRVTSKHLLFKKHTSIDIRNEQTQLFCHESSSGTFEDLTIIELVVHIFHVF